MHHWGDDEDYNQGEYIRDAQSRAYEGWWNGISEQVKWRPLKKFITEYWDYAPRGSEKVKDIYRDDWKNNAEFAVAIRSTC